MTLHKWTAAEERQIAALVRRKHTNKEIAAIMGCTPDQIAGKVKHLGLSGLRRQRRYKGLSRRMNRTARERLESEARKRGLDLLELEYRLLEAIARDGLVDAILDDARGAAA